MIGRGVALRTSPSSHADSLLPLEATVVVYDLEEITPEAFAKSQSFLGPRPAMHLHRADALFPPGIRVGARPFPSTRSVELLEYGMGRVEEIGALIRKLGAGALLVDDIELAQVARFDLQFAARDAFQRDWLCRQIIAGKQVREVVWVTGEGRYSGAFVNHLASALPRAGIRFVPILVGPSRRQLSVGTLRIRNVAVAQRRIAGAAFRAALQRRPRISLPQRARIVFVENYTKSARLALTVALETQLRDNVESWFLVTKRETRDALQGAGLERLFLLDDLVRPATWMSAIVAQWRVDRAAARLAGMLARPGADSPHFEGPQLAITASREWRKAALMTLLWRDAFERIRPSAIASTSQINTFATAAVAVGRTVGARSFFIQHGAMMHDSFERDVAYDHFILWGERDRRRRVALGTAPDAITVTGPPDLVMNPGTVPDDRDRRDARFRVAYLPARTGGAWISGRNAASHFRMIRDALAMVGNADLVVKPHPSDLSRAFMPLDADEPITVIRDVPTSAVIRSADLVIVTATSAGLDACALDRPVIVLHLDGERVVPHYTEYGAVLFATSTAELATAVRAVRGDASLRERLRVNRIRMNDDLFDGLRPGGPGRIADALVSGAIAQAERVGLSSK